MCVILLVQLWRKKRDTFDMPTASIQLPNMESSISSFNDTMELLTGWTIRLDNAGVKMLTLTKEAG